MAQQNRLLTHDERKAAEAAFKGEPFNPKWSEAARKVYLGLSSALANKRQDAFQEVPPVSGFTGKKRVVTESKLKSRIKSTLW